MWILRTAYTHSAQNPNPEQSLGHLSVVSRGAGLIYDHSD
jgi:hypothetical protein